MTDAAPTMAMPATMKTRPNQCWKWRRRLRNMIENMAVKKTIAPRSIWYTLVEVCGRKRLRVASQGGTVTTRALRFDEARRSCVRGVPVVYGACTSQVSVALSTNRTNGGYVGEADVHEGGRREIAARGDGKHEEDDELVLDLLRRLHTQQISCK
eukprot:Opistho-1_new@13670